MSGRKRGRKSTRTRDRKRQAPRRTASARTPQRRATPSVTVPVLGDQWKLTRVAQSIHLHPKTLHRWTHGQPFVTKVRGTTFIEMDGFRAWWARQGFATEDAP